MNSMLRKCSRKTQRLRARRGAVLVEMTICLSIFMFLLMALIQYERILYTMTTLDQYAREGVRYTSANWSNIGFNSASTSASSGSFWSYMTEVCNTKSIPYSALSSANVDVPVNGTETPMSYSGCTSSCTSVAKGNLVTVTLTYDMTKTYIFYGIVPGLPKPWTYTAQSTMVAE